MVNRLHKTLKIGLLGAIACLALPSETAAQECSFNISAYVEYWYSSDEDIQVYGNGVDESTCQEYGHYPHIHVHATGSQTGTIYTDAPGSSEAVAHFRVTVEETLYYGSNFQIFCFGIYAWYGPVGVSSSTQVQPPPPPPQWPIPSGEDITFLGWQGDGGISMWYQFLQPSNVNFAGRTVKEFSGTGTDSCWFEGSALQPFTALTGGEWPVEGAENGWGPDYLSWAQEDIDYYRAQGKAPCSTTIPQSMRINVPGEGYVEYLNHDLIFTIGVTSITYQRGNAEPASKTWP